MSSVWCWISASPGLARQWATPRGASFGNTWQVVHSYSSPLSSYTLRTHNAHTYQFPSSPWASALGQQKVSALGSKVGCTLARNNEQMNEWPRPQYKCSLAFLDSRFPCGSRANRPLYLHFPHPHLLLYLFVSFTRTPRPARSVMCVAAVHRDQQIAGWTVRWKQMTRRLSAAISTCPSTRKPGSEDGSLFTATLFSTRSKLTRWATEYSGANDNAKVVVCGGATGRALDLQSTGRGFKFYSGQKLHNKLGLVFSHICVSVTKQYNLVPAKGR